ncbi:hypothetical protein chiPu_0029954, partial [Chiloscyllium punctatum]|nr:hypothetical protein [Chiloscyllium punctatum]
MGRETETREKERGDGERERERERERKRGGHGETEREERKKDSDPGSRASDLCLFSVCAVCPSSGPGFLVWEIRDRLPVWFPTFPTGRLTPWQPGEKYTVRSQRKLLGRLASHMDWVLCPSPHTRSCYTVRSHCPPHSRVASSKLPLTRALPAFSRSLCLRYSWNSSQRAAQRDSVSCREERGPWRDPGATRDWTVPDRLNPEGATHPTGRDGEGGGERE